MLGSDAALAGPIRAVVLPPHHSSSCPLVSSVSNRIPAAESPQQMAVESVSLPSPNPSRFLNVVGHCPALGSRRLAVLHFSGTPSSKCRTNQCGILGVSCLVQGDKNEYVLGRELGVGLEFLGVTTHSLLATLRSSPPPHNPTKVTAHVQETLPNSSLSHRTY